MIQGVPASPTIPAMRLDHVLTSLHRPALCLLLVVGCAASAAPKQETAMQPSSANADSRALVERYRTDRGALQSFYDLPHSATRLERLAAYDRVWSAELDAVDYDALDTAGRIDWHLLRTEIAYGAAERGRLERQLGGAEALLPFADAIHTLEETRWLIEAVDAEAAAEQLTAIAEAAEEVKSRVKLRPAPDDEGDDAQDEDEAAEDSDEDDDAAEDSDDEEPPIYVDPVEARRVAGWVSSMRRSLGTWYTHYEEFLPGFDWWCGEPYAEARKNLDALAKHLREKIAQQKGEEDDPLIGDPIGREGLLEDLAHEWLAYTPEELIAVGEREFAWCEARLLEASNELGHGDDWKAALAAVKALHVAPGEQDALVARQAREAIAWLRSNDLVTIPPLCEETWRVQMIGEATQRTLPFAAYGGQKMLVAFPTSGMDHEAKLMALRGNNEHFTRCVTPHELIPGHHLQGFMAQRYATHRSLFRTPFLVEGWALYWEMVEWDLGWPRGPEDRIGMLFWRMHRAARILVSLKFHLGQMEPQEMIDFLVDRVGHEVSGATSEVRRYIGGGYSPLYQCGYMIGGLQLRALAEEVVDSGRMTRKEFHDAVLRENSIPVEMVRAALLGQELAKDAGPSWKPELGTR